MAPNKFNGLYLAAVALVLLIGAAQSPRAAARSFINVNPFCRTANYRRVCNQMVRGATTWSEASANAMDSTRELATRLKGLVPLLKPSIAHLKPITQDSIMKTCVENFDGIVDDMEVSLQAVQAGDMGTARSHLSAAFRTDCKDAMKESGAPFPVNLNKYSKHLNIHVDNCFAVLLQN